MAEDHKSIQKLTVTNSWWNYLSWNSFSYDMLRSVEKTILSYLSTKYRGFFVDIGSVVGDSGSKVWTIALNEAADKNTPLVLLHGLGAGSALWVMNFDELAKKRPVYSIDILGFGKSSRPTFDKDPDVAEMQFVQSINEWRREMQISKMILCGHSFGSYLACSYALVYPDYVKHLILNDPWGFPQRPKEEDLEKKYNVPLWVKAIAYAVQPLNPLWLVRASGPFGQWVVEKTRPDIMRKYKSFVKEESAIAQYIHQCNSQNPTGEAAFHSMMESFGWARKPMINRIHEMRKDVPLTLVYGSKSWVDHSSGNIIKKARPSSYVKVHVINNSGHHVYADQPAEFNSIIVKTCDLADDEIEEKSDDEEESR